ncbi:UDP-N-acetylglucosamine--N-acetylmuramyl-(pentapeptide) pyrophosphoryl-undecaprenol N-acetylglucosamine transferase [Desulfovibrionales bacterium]
MQRVILTTGGTGGHIFPALAVAEELRVRFPYIQLLFVGGNSGPEGKLAAKSGLEFIGLPARGMVGRGFKALTAIGWMTVSLTKALQIVGHFKPDAVIGFGGYAAFATVLAGALCGSLTAIHEQNNIPGVSNRLISHIVKRIFLSFPDKKNFFPRDKILLIGNPVRAAIRQSFSATQAVDQIMDQSLAEVAPINNHPGRLLVLGGSQGARAVNTAILMALPRLAKANVAIWHQCGWSDVKRVMQGYTKAGLAQYLVDGQPVIRIEAFIENMAAAYTWANLVVCRAGATTIAELSVAGKPAIFIPLPCATHNHQFHNANFLEQSGAALLVEEKNFDHIDLAYVIIELLTDIPKRTSMSQASRKLARPEATTDLVAELQRLT